MPHCKTVFKFSGAGKENWMFTSFLWLMMCAPVIFLMREWSFTWMLTIWIRRVYSLTQNLFSKSGCRGFAGICSLPCGPHTDPQNLCHIVERVLNIIVAKSIIIYTPNKNKARQLSQKQIFPGCWYNCWTFMPPWSIPCSQEAKVAPPLPPSLPIWLLLEI